MLKKVPERTLRHWLSDMVKAGTLKKIGAKRNTKYIYSGDVSKICFSKESINSIKKINLPIFKRTPIGFNKNFLEKYIPNKT